MRNPIRRTLGTGAVAALMSAALLLSLTACQPESGGTQSAPPESEAAEILGENVAETPQENRPIDDEQIPASVAGSSSGVVEAILATYSAKEFSDEPVSQEDLEQVLLVGAKAASARNLQPWHFVVARDAADLGIGAATEGTVAIVVCGSSEYGDGEGMNVSFDCGMATANMYNAAQALGMGAHIYMGGVREINSDPEKYGVPDGYEALMLLLIGHTDPNVDGVAAASSRNPLDEVVTYLD